MRAVSSPSIPPAALAGLLALVPGLAQASGFALFEPGGPGFGRAGASLTQSVDASSLAYNPALIAFLRERQLSLGASLFSGSASFQGADPAPGAAVRESAERRLLVPPGVFYTHRLTERLVVGLGVYEPFAFKTGWREPDSFSGRFISQRAALETDAVTPTVAYRLADRLAFGAGLDVRVSRLELERRVAAQVGDALVDAAALRIETGRTMNVGFHLGMLAKPTEDLSFALVYQSGTIVKAEGTGRLQLLPTGNAKVDAAIAGVLPAGTVPVRAGVALPAHVAGGTAYSRGDWVFETDVAWSRWSALDGIPIVFDGKPELSGTIPLSYRNAWEARLGVERALSAAWTLRGGYFFEQSPTPPATLSPFLPDADRHGLALGGAWTHHRLRVDAGGFYALSPARASAGGAQGYQGTYSTSRAGAALSFGFVF